MSSLNLHSIDGDDGGVISHLTEKCTLRTGFFFCPRDPQLHCKKTLSGRKMITDTLPDGPIKGAFLKYMLLVDAQVLTVNMDLLPRGGVCLRL